jgi:ribosomal protein L16/L10AE
MSFVRSLLSPLRPCLNSAFPPTLLFGNVQSRGRAQLAPKAVKYMKRHKGKLPIPIGGSTKGTVLAYGDYGIRIRGNGMRFSAKQLTTAQEVLKRKLKSIKHAKVYLRLFPDVPVCVKVCKSIYYYHHDTTLKPYAPRVTRHGWGKGREVLSFGQHGSGQLVLSLR